MSMPLIPEPRCTYCEQPSDVLVTYVDGVSICLGCREREQARVAGRRYAEAGFGGMQPLEQWHADGNR